MRKIITFGLLIVGAILLSVVFSNGNLFKPNQNKNVAVVGLTDTNLSDTPSLDLPLHYFTNKSIAWGSVDTSRNSDDKNTWKYAVVDGGDAYQSFPTKTITLSTNDFSNDTEQMPPIQSMEQILKQDIEEDTLWQWLYKEQIAEYGNIATRFLPADYITNLRKFDTDKDGKDEEIIFLCGVGGNHCPHRIVVVKDQKIIFSVSAGLTGLDLSKTETGNGFYVHWVPTEEKWDRGLCCPLGYIKTRFVYKKGKFLPAYEQEVLYFEIKNTD
ncbi:MAG: hypothetical protein AAB738_01645 [Patescibacteria group bacterium]